MIHFHSNFVHFDSHSLAENRTEIVFKPNSFSTMGQNLKFLTKSFLSILFTLWDNSLKNDSMKYVESHAENFIAEWDPLKTHRVPRKPLP